MRPIARLLLALLFALSARAPSGAATNGLAYDAVTRTNAGAMMGQGPSNLEPAVSFDEAFDLASKSTAVPDRSFNPFNMAAAKNALNQAQASIRNGTAERHFFLGSRERVDRVGEQTSTIRDCAAGTLTTLNHKDKTYRIESLSSSAPSGSGSHGGKPDEMTSMTVKMTTSTLPPLTIDNTSTQGYGADMQITMVNAGSPPTNMEMKAQLYFSNFAQPLLACAPPGSGGGQQGGGQVASQGGMVGWALSKDKRVSTTITGPPIPTNRLALWEVTEPVMSGSDVPNASGTGNPRGGGKNASNGTGGAPLKTAVQRGHIRVLTDADSALFAPPADYRQEK